LNTPGIALPTRQPKWISVYTCHARSPVATYPPPRGDRNEFRSTLHLARHGRHERWSTYLRNAVMLNLHKVFCERRTAPPDVAHHSDRLTFLPPHRADPRRGRFFGKPLRAISRFRHQNAQTPPSPLVGERGRGDEGQKRTEYRTSLISPKNSTLESRGDEGQKRAGMQKTTDLSQEIYP
jgi:hypothetical protein